LFFETNFFIEIGDRSTMNTRVDLLSRWRALKRFRKTLEGDLN